MAIAIYNSDLLNTISDVKKGANKSLVIEVAGASSRNKHFTNEALKQVKDLFNNIYSSTYKCSGSLDLSFKIVKNSASESAIFLHGLSDTSALSDIIYKVLKELGINLPSNFLNKDYIASNNLIINSEGYIQGNALISNKSTRLLVYSAYGSPSIPTPVVYGVTTPTASNYNPAATKDDGTALPPITTPLTPIYASRLIRNSSNPYFGSIIDVSEGSNEFLNLNNLHSGIEDTAVNSAKTIPTSKVTGASSAESFVITDLEGKKLLSFYKNTASEFEVADRMGHNIYGANGTNLIKISRYSTGIDIPANSESNIMSDDNMYGSPKLFASYTNDGNSSIVSVFSYSKGEVQILHFDLNRHNLGLSNSEIVNVLDCTNPEIPLGNLLQPSGGFHNIFGHPSLSDSYSILGSSQETITSGIFLNSDIFYIGSAEQSTIGSRFPNNPPGGTNSLLRLYSESTTDPIGNVSYANWYGGFRQFIESINKVGGTQISDFAWPAQHDIAFPDTTLATSWIYQSPLYKWRPGAGEIVQEGSRLVSSKILSTYAPIFSQDLGIQPNLSMPEFGTINANYIDNTAHKTWVPFIIVFDSISSKYMVIPLLSYENVPEDPILQPILNIDPFIDKGYGEPNYSTVLGKRPDENGVDQTYYVPSLQEGGRSTIGFLKGFSFDSEEQIGDYGLYFISGNKYNSPKTNSSGSSWPYTFSLASDEYTVPAGVSPDPFNLTPTGLLLQQCPVAMSYKKRAVTSNMTSTLYNPFMVMADQPSNTLGCYMVAHGILHGFILTYMNEYGQFLPPYPYDTGMELHIIGGDYNNDRVQEEGGFMPVSMVFSPGDNYLYTIVQSKLEGDKFICIYNLESLKTHVQGNPIEGSNEGPTVSILENTYMISNPFQGDLTRVDRGHDGAIYFFSHNSTEFIKLANPDNSESVELLINFPALNIQNSIHSFDYLPSMSSVTSSEDWVDSGRHLNWQEGEQTSADEVVILKDTNSLNFLLTNRASGGLVFDLNTRTVVAKSSDTEYNVVDQEVESPGLFYLSNSSNILLRSEMDMDFKSEGTLVPRVTFDDILLNTITDIPSFIIKFSRTITYRHEFYIHKIVDYNQGSYDIASIPFYDSEGDIISQEQLQVADFNYDSSGGNRTRKPFQMTGNNPFGIATIDTTNSGNLLPYNNKNFLQNVTGVINYIFSFSSSTSYVNLNILVTPQSTEAGITTALPTKGYNKVKFPTSILGFSTDERPLQGYAVIKEKRNSQWLFSVGYRSSSNAYNFYLHLNKIDSGFDVYNLFGAEEENRVSFSQSISRHLNQDITTAYVNSTSYNGSSTESVQKSFSLYPNVDASKLCLIIDEGHTGGQFILLYNFNSSTGDLTLIRQLIPSTIFKRAIGIGGEGDFVRPEIIIKKAVFNIDSSILYLLTVNKSITNPRHSNHIIALNMSSIEGLDAASSIPPTDQYIKIVPNYPAIPESDNLGNRIWPEEFSSSFNPLLRMQADSVDNFTYTQFIDDGNDYDSTPPSPVCVDNIFLGKDGHIYISSRIVEDFFLTALPGNESRDTYSMKNSIGKIINSTYWNDVKYALNAIEVNKDSQVLGEISASSIKDLKYSQTVFQGPATADGKNDEVKFSGETLHAPVTRFGCSEQYTIIDGVSIPNINYDPNAAFGCDTVYQIYPNPPESILDQCTCVLAPHNGPVEYGGTGVTGFNSDDFVYCNPSGGYTAILPDCSTCLTPDDLYAYENTTGYANSICGMCTDPAAMNYDGEAVPGFSISNPSQCIYKACTDSNACNQVTDLAPNGTEYQPCVDCCNYPAPQCNCNGNPIDPTACGSCEDNTIYTQTGLAEGYCDCGNVLLPIPNEQIGSAIWTNWNNQNPGNPMTYCDCEGNLPSTACHCDGTLINLGYTPGTSAHNYYAACDCEGNTAYSLHGPNCNCDGVVTDPDACNCKSGKVIHYLDEDDDSICREGSGILLCPQYAADLVTIIGPYNGDGQNWRLATDCTDFERTPEDQCAGAIDECGNCIAGGVNDPEYCSNGLDDCGICCGGNADKNCNGVCFEPDPVYDGTPNGCCNGYVPCECANGGLGGCIPEGQYCPTLQDCGCDAGNFTECGDCEGPDPNGCCSGTYLDSCLNECVPVGTPPTIEDLCGHCSVFPETDPLFNSCVGCTDQDALNYGADFTVSCADCCEYETYIPPVIIGTINLDTDVQANLTSGYIALPPTVGSELPLNIYKEKFNYDGVDVRLTNWPNCIFNGTCHSYGPVETVSNINNPSFTNKVQVISEGTGDFPKNYIIQMNHPWVNAEVTLMQVIPEGFVVDVEGNYGTESAIEHYRLNSYLNNTEPDGRSDINIPSVGFLHNNLNEITSGSTLLYVPRYYFRVESDVEFTTNVFATLLHGYENKIKSIARYHIPIDFDLNESTNKNIEKVLNAHREVVYTSANSRSSNSILEQGTVGNYSGRYPNSNDITSIKGYIIYEIIPETTQYGEHLEAEIDLGPWRNPQSSKWNVCCDSIADNFMVIDSAGLNGTDLDYFISIFGSEGQHLIDQAYWDQIMAAGEMDPGSGITAAEVSCDNNMCIYTQEEDPCETSVRTCLDPTALNFNSLGLEIPEGLDTSLPLSEEAIAFYVENCASIADPYFGCLYPDPEPPTCCDDDYEGTITQVCCNQAAINVFDFSSLPEDEQCCYICEGAREGRSTVCEFAPDPVIGCLDTNACNYDSSADTECADCCDYTCIGCMDTSACNFCDGCTVPDNSQCVYAEEGYDCTGELLNPPAPCTDTIWNVSYTQGESGEYRIETYIFYSENNTASYNPNLEWVIYGVNQDVLLQSPPASEYGTSYIAPGAMFNSTSIQIATNQCAWFLPLGVEKNPLWEQVILLIKDATGTIVHSIEHGFTRTNTGSALLSPYRDACTFGCSLSSNSIVTEDCEVCVARDHEDYTEFVLQVVTSNSSTIDYTNVVVDLVTIDGNERLAHTEEMQPNNTYQDSFVINRTTKVAIKYYAPTDTDTPIECRIVKRDGTFVTSKSFTGLNNDHIAAFTLCLHIEGCMDPKAPNYNPNATHDDGSCLNSELRKCAEEALCELDLGDCNNEKTEKALKLYTIYKAYLESLNGLNETKTQMYLDKLIDLCNCKTCKCVDCYE